MGDPLQQGLERTRIGIKERKVEKTPVMLYNIYITKP